ncbi:MAG: extracellular solute-binding protein [Candidatus Andersenbacteria bacterium]
MSVSPKSTALAILVIVSAASLLGFGCRRPQGGLGDSTSQKLVVWGLWQESADMDAVVKAFQEQTGVGVEYKKIGSVATYEKTLLGALAEGRGPDVFVIHHTWIEGKRGLLSPAPSEVINLRQLKDEFVSVVEEDVVRDGLIYALPTSVDTLGLYYNQDLLSAAGVARPPRTWQDFQRTIESITKVSRLGIIEQSGAAIGTASNVNRAGDILQLLMIQSGLDVIGSTGRIDIDNEAGEKALIFYTDFSNKSKKVYTWDLTQDFSIDAFAAGKTAIMLNYSYHLPTLKAKNPRLRFGIAPMPQIADSTPVTFASYWPFAVSPSSQAPQAAWQFVRFLTSAPIAQIINDAQGAPPALRESIVAARSNPELGVFADQALLATSWPRVDIVATDAIFNAMIDEVVTGSITVKDALRRAQDQLQQLIPNDANPS